MDDAEKIASRWAKGSLRVAAAWSAALGVVSLLGGPFTGSAGVPRVRRFFYDVADSASNAIQSVSRLLAKIDLLGEDPRSFNRSIAEEAGMSTRWPRSIYESLPRGMPETRGWRSGMEANMKSGINAPPQSRRHNDAADASQETRASEIEEGVDALVGASVNRGTHSRPIRS